MQTLNNNPVTVSGLILTLALAVLALAAYYLQMTPEEVALWGTVLTALSAVLHWWLNRATTPLANPKDATGMPLSGPNGEPTIAQVRSAKVR